MLGVGIEPPQLLDNLFLGGYGLLADHQQLQQLALLQVQLHFLAVHCQPQVGGVQL
ncbi:hypothetical protein D3C73_1420930 [compost metagenome]